MKKTVSSIALVLALTACGPEQLSTEETCDEIMAIVNASDSNKEVTEESSLKLIRQMSDLAERASDPLKDELELITKTFAVKGEGAVESAGEELEVANNTINEVCFS